MAHPLGARFDIAHGVANALLLPIVMEYNMPAAVEKYCEIAKAMGVDTTGMTKDHIDRAELDQILIGDDKRLAESAPRNLVFEFLSRAATE